MEISLEQFKPHIPSVALDDAVIQRYLADAKRAVVRDGFSETNADFDELQRLYALGLMQQDKVAGVRSATLYKDAYTELVRIAMANRLFVRRLFVQLALTRRQEARMRRAEAIRYESEEDGPHQLKQM